MIEFDHLSKTYPRNGQGDLKALEQISFRVQRGEFLAILGPSGCGKTTLISIAAGLLAPSSGSVRVLGRNLEAPHPQLTVIFQEVALFPWKTALKNVEFALQGRGLKDAQQRQQQAQSWLRSVGLEGFENCYPQELSGGMQQRAGIARALAFDPECILMDEPFSALDANLREELQQQLQHIFQVTGKTMLLVTHDLDEALMLADRVMLMTSRPGRILNEYKVPLPRPRLPEIYAQPEFLSLRQEIHQALKNHPPLNINTPEKTFA